jgi:PAS domain S-box-containing protein
MNNASLLDSFTQIIEKIYPSDFIIDFEGNLVFSGRDFNSVFNIENPLQKSFFELFKIQKSDLKTLLENASLNADVKFNLNAKFLKENHQVEVQCSQLNDTYIYCKSSISKASHESNRIAEDLIKKIDKDLTLNDFLLSILYNLPSDIGVFDLDHKYIYLNPAAVQKNEVRDFLIGKTDFDYCELRGIDTKMAQDRHALFQEVFTSEKTSAWEDSHVQPDGSIKTVLRRFSPIFNPNQKLIGVMGYGIDISPIKIAQQEAKFNEERYKSLFENNMAGVFRTNENGDILEVNQAYAKIFGFESVAELENFKSSSFYPSPEARANYISLLKEKGSLENYLLKNIRKDGKVIQLLVNVTYSATGETSGIIEGTLLDITALSEANEKLANQKKDLERLAYFLDQTSDAIQVVDETGHFVYLNKTACERLGIPQEETRNYTIFDIENYFKSTADWQLHILELQKIGKIMIEANHNNIVTGTKIPVEITAIPREFDGKTYVISSSRDITEKKQAQAVLDEKNKFVQDLTSAVNASSLVSVTDKSGKIINANDNFCRTSGYTLDELLGADHSIVNSGYHTKDFWKQIYETIFAGKTWHGEIRNKKKDGSFYWVNTVIYPILNEQGDPHEFMSIRQDITHAKQNELIIQKQVNLQDLLMRTGTRLINLEPENLDTEINDALEEIGLFVDADRSYIFDYNTDNQTTSNTYEWCREGITPQIDELQHIPFSEVPKWIEVHFKGEIMDIPSVAQLEEGRFKELLEVQDIKSLIAFPMMDGNSCIGFIGFDSVRSEHIFNETDKIILELFAEMVVNIKKRLDFIQRIEVANKKYIDINEGLERTVAEKTAKNNELTQMMSTQDKLAMIGEITAGITHDLNTPIGAIKVGAESIRYTLENLFKSVIEKCSTEQLHYSCSRSTQMNVQMFVGGLQMMRETKQVLGYLNANYPELNDDADKLASALVKARILDDEPEVIEKIIKAPNSLEFIDLIYHIQSVRTFVDTVLEAGDKSASVIRNLRFYLKEGGNMEKVDVNLANNLRTVLNVFNHQLKSNIDLQFDVSEDLVVFGYENKLYQLWSNLIKNAIDAIGDSGQLIIKGKSNGNLIEVTVTNSGKMIPVEIQDRIFEKFFTTKSSANGTGLGLSIVKKVIEEHSAKIRLTSDDAFTSFIVTFETSINHSI